MAYLIFAATSIFAAAATATREQVLSQLESGATDLSNLQAAGLDLSGVDFRAARLFGGIWMAPTFPMPRSLVATLT